MQIRRLSWLAGGTCKRLTVVSLKASMVFSVKRTSPNHNVRDIVDVTAMGKEVKYSYYLHFLYTRPVYQNYNLQKPLTLIEAKLMGLATKDINIPCMHAEVRRLVCMALH